MRVVAHRHSQYALTVVFSGNFPGSKEQIATDASLLAILCQTLLFYLPGLIVHTRPATLISNVSASTPRVADSRRADRLLRSHKSSRFGRLSGSLPLSRSSSADTVPAPAVPATKPVLARTNMATSMATMIGGEQWDPYMLPSAARDIFESALAKEEQMNEAALDGSGSSLALVSCAGAAGIPDDEEGATEEVVVVTSGGAQPRPPLLNIIYIP